jgi:hypothetical protein
MTSIAYKQPHGWSKLDTYRECPAKFKYQYIDKLPQPESPALTRGGKVHNALEQYLNGWSKTWPADIQPMWKDYADKMLASYDVRTEAAWGVDRKWVLQPNWLTPATWIRAKGDFFHRAGKTTLKMGDWKTGQYRVPSDDQIELYAIFGLSVYPDVKDVITSFIFVDQKEKPLELRYTAKQLVNLRGKFEQEFLKMEKERKWAPTPSAKCKWCPYSKQKGGPCKY